MVRLTTKPVLHPEGAKGISRPERSAAAAWSPAGHQNGIDQGHAEEEEEDPADHSDHGDGQQHAPDVLHGHGDQQDDEGDALDDADDAERLIDELSIRSRNWYQIVDASSPMLLTMLEGHAGNMIGPN